MVFNDLLIDINLNPPFIRTLEFSITSTVLIPIVLLQILLILEAHEEYIVPLKGLTAAEYYFPHNYLHFCVWPTFWKQQNIKQSTVFVFKHDQWILKCLRTTAHLINFFPSAKQQSRWAALFMLKRRNEGSKKEKPKKPTSLNMFLWANL